MSTTARSQSLRKDDDVAIRLRPLRGRRDALEEDESACFAACASAHRGEGAVAGAGRTFEVNLRRKLPRPAEARLGSAPVLRGRGLHVTFTRAKTEDRTRFVTIAGAKTVVVALYQSGLGQQ